MSDDIKVYLTLSDQVLLSSLNCRIVPPNFFSFAKVFDAVNIYNSVENTHDIPDEKNPHAVVMRVGFFLAIHVLRDAGLLKEDV